MSLWTRITNAFGGERLNRELDAEMRVHIEEALAAGRTEEDARRAFGGLLRMRERSRDIKVLGWLEAVVADARFGVRQLRKNWMVSGAAILSLALAIGACTGAFRLIDAVLLRPLPVADPERLYYLTYPILDQARVSQEADSFAYPLYRRFREAVKEDAQVLVIAGTARRYVTYPSSTEAERVYEQYFSGNAFGAFGMKPALGRLLSPADEKQGAPPVAVLSYNYWKSRFGRDPKVVGRTFTRGAELFQIVGVASEGFTGTETGRITSLFVPATMNRDALEKDNWQWFRIWIRPAPGRTIDFVRDRLQAVYSVHQRESLAKWDSDAPPDRVDHFLKTRLEVRSAAGGASETRNEYGRALVILGVLVGLVLMIACANVANLMTAQAAARSREMALRVSIGAGRLRLVQLVLVESAILAAAATVLGAVFAWWSAPLVASMVNPPDNPLQLVLPADWRVLAFAAAIAAGVTLFFGLVPALRASSVKPVSALKGGEDSHTRQRFLHGMVWAQIAFCCVVNFAAGLFVVTFQRLSSQPTGFSADRVLLLETVVDLKRRAEVWRQVGDRLRPISGVESVALCGWPLMSGNGWSNSVRIPGQPPDDFEPYFLSVSPGFVSTIGSALIAGRDFDSHDTAGSAEKGQESPGVAIVSEAFARRYFHGQNPVGRVFERSIGNNVMIRHEIVGYVKDLRYRTLREPMYPVVLVPAAETSWATFAVRTAAEDSALLAPVLRREVSQARADFHVISTNSQRDLVNQWTIRERLLATLSLFFATLALLLAGIGLFGVLNYSVLQRTREIGIRMALGAGAPHVIAKVLAQVLAVVAAGIVTGLSAGLASERFFESLLYSAKGSEPGMIALPVLGLLAAALLAAVPPVLRAVRIDPAQALRSE